MEKISIIKVDENANIELDIVEESTLQVELKEIVLSDNIIVLVDEDSKSEYLNGILSYICNDTIVGEGILLGNLATTQNIET